MAPRVLPVLIGVLVCALVLVASHVAAAEESVATTHADEQTTTGYDIDRVPAPVDNCPRGCCQLFGTSCIRCCTPAETSSNAVDDSKQVHGCRRGCCGWFRGRCVRCCPPAEASADAVDDSKQVHGCNTGCCNWVRGRCVRCCGASETAADALIGGEPHN